MITVSVYLHLKECYYAIVVLSALQLGKFTDLRAAVVLGGDR